MMSLALDRKDLTEDRWRARSSCVGPLGMSARGMRTEKVIFNSTSCAVTETGESGTITLEPRHGPCTMGFP